MNGQTLQQSALNLLVLILVMYSVYMHLTMNKKIQYALDRHNALQLISTGTTRSMELQSPPSIRVGTSIVHGNGVYATTDYFEGDLIESCPILIIRRDGSHALVNYVFSDPEQPKTRVILALGYGSLYNHSDTPNARTRFTTKNCLDIVALKKIGNGEEITFNYGPKYWKHQEMISRLKSSIK